MPARIAPSNGDDRREVRFGEADAVAAVASTAHTASGSTLGSGSVLHQAHAEPPSWSDSSEPLRTPGWFSSKFRHRAQCTLCVLKNGKQCKRCSIPRDGVAKEQLLLPGDRPLKGLASATWITDSILAMSRPSRQGIDEYHLPYVCMCNTTSPHTTTTPPHHHHCHHRHHTPRLPPRAAHPLTPQLAVRGARCAARIQPSRARGAPVLRPSAGAAQHVHVRGGLSREAGHRGHRRRLG